MYVCVHEMAHMFNDNKSFEDEDSHDEKFWRLNKLLLRLAVEIDVYKYEDYSKTPFFYNNKMVDQNILD